MLLSHFVTTLSETRLSTWLRYSPYPFPILIMTHVVTIALFGGIVAMGNLRVLGYGMRETPVSEVLNQFRVWKWMGFALLLITGGLITISDPIEYYSNIMFWISLALLALAGVNAWIFHNGAEQTVAEWDTASPTPRAARRWAICSIILWISLVGAGRAIAFF
jgi:hypothetical protein